MDKMNGKTMDIVAENISKLKALFPEAFTEGKVDFEALKEALGEFVDEREERYNFTWNGKSKARMIAQTPSTGTLRPCKEESVDWDTTQNLFLEGDNLEALKLLQKSYHKKVKMIYIDPPYNTGHDFVYKDNFQDNIKNYKEITGQVDGNGRNLSNNPETSGRYHTDWLNMMYPRLKLARNLLKDDGVIFISIDDNEVSNLRKMCDEIFGEENFIAQYIHKNNSSKNQAKLVSVSTEYFYCYAKDKFNLKDALWHLRKKGAEAIAKLFNRLKKDGLSLKEIESEIKEMYKRPKYAHLSRWNKVDDQGVFVDADLSREGGPRNYTIINPNTGEKCLVPNRGWGKSEEELLRLQEANLIWYGIIDTPPRMKEYINPNDVSVPDNFWYFDNSVDTRWCKSEFGSLIFENPKPLEMLKSIIEMVDMESNDIILDFFAGSATTAHAVMQLNAEDGGKRKYIMVQLPEACGEKSEAYKAGYKTIAEISKERIRRAGKQIIDNGKLRMENEELKMNNEELRKIENEKLRIENENEKLKMKDEEWREIENEVWRMVNKKLKIKNEELKIENEELELENEELELEMENEELRKVENEELKMENEKKPSQLDIGFKVFKLDSTNIKPWEVDFDLDETQLEAFVENIKPNRTEEDILYEVLLKYGLELTLPIDEFRMDNGEWRKVKNGKLTMENEKKHSQLSNVYSIGRGSLIICLGDTISLELVQRIASLKDKLNPEIMRVVFKDSGFKDDVVKTNAVQILKQAGINEVKSI